MPGRLSIRYSDQRPNRNAPRGPLQGSSDKDATNGRVSSVKARGGTAAGGGDWTAVNPTDGDNDEGSETAERRRRAGRYIAAHINRPCSGARPLHEARQYCRWRGRARDELRSVDGWRWPMSAHWRLGTCACLLGPRVLWTSVEERLCALLTKKVMRLCRRPCGADAVKRWTPVFEIRCLTPSRHGAKATLTFACIGERLGSRPTHRPRSFRFADRDGWPQCRYKSSRTDGNIDLLFRLNAYGQAITGNV